MNFTVAGELPVGGKLQVEAIDASCNDYIVETYLKDVELPAGAPMAYDLTILTEDGKVYSPAAGSEFTVTMSSNDGTVIDAMAAYHLPGVTAKQIAGAVKALADAEAETGTQAEAEAQPAATDAQGDPIRLYEEMNVESYDGGEKRFFHFTTDGFSTYFLVAQLAEEEKVCTCEATDEEKAAEDFVHTNETCPFYEAPAPVELTAEADGLSFAVSGAFPAEAQLSVTKLSDGAVEYIHNSVLNLDALTEDQTSFAYDIKVLANGEEVQPDGQVQVTITGTDTAADSDVQVYHLPGTNADMIESKLSPVSFFTTFSVKYSAEITAEECAAVPGDGQISFTTDGFSTYYVVSGSSQTGKYDQDYFRVEKGANEIVHVAPGTTIRFFREGGTYNYWKFNKSVSGITGVTNGKNIGTSWTGNATSINAHEYATVTIASNVKDGTEVILYSCQAISKRDQGQVKIIVQSNKSLVDSILQDTTGNYPVFVAVLEDSRSIPGEPSVTSKSYDYLMANYAGISDKSSEFASSASGLILPSITSSPYFVSSVDNTSTMGVVDATGVRTKAFLGSIDWNRYLNLIAAQGNRVATDGTKVTTANKDQYEIIPYVVKIQTTYSMGWHIDCYIARSSDITLQYNLNLPSGVTVENIVTPNSVRGASPLNVTVARASVNGREINIGDKVTTSTGENITFNGWYTTPNGTGKQYIPGDPASFTGNTTLYADWISSSTIGDLQIHKVVETRPGSVAPTSDDVFTFTVSIPASGSFDYKVYSEAGVDTGVSGKISNGGTITLKGGQFAQIFRLPKDIECIVTETNIPAGYTAQAEVQRSTIKGGTHAALTFVNTYIGALSDASVAIGINESYYYTDFQYTVTASGVATSSYHAYPNEPAVQKIVYMRPTDTTGSWVIEPEGALAGKAPRYIDPSILTSTKYTKSVILNDITWGVADPTGADTWAFLKFSEADKQAIIQAWLQNMADRTADTPNADGTYNITCKGTTYITDVNWNNEVSKWQEYQIIPYVVKCQGGGTDWYIDMVIVRSSMVTLAYNMNIPEGYSLIGPSIPTKQYNRDEVAPVYRTPQDYDPTIRVIKIVNGVEYEAEFLYWKEGEDMYGGSGNPTQITMDSNKILYAAWDDPTMTRGNLEIKKQVVVAPGSEQPASDQSFTLKLTLNGTNETKSYSYTKCNASGIKIGTGEISNGGTFELKDREYIVIGGIPKGATYEVTEPTPPAGYTVKKATGTIVADTKAVVINTYSEQSVTINYVAVGSGSVSPTTETLTSSQTAQGSVPTPATNYEFVGWYTDKDCTTPVNEGWVNSSTNKLTPQKEDGKYKEATYYAKFERMTASLKITKTGMNNGENAIFIVTGEGLGNGLKVSVPNGGSVKINGLFVGATYTVAEETGWSSCYTASGLGDVTITEDGSTVNVNNTLNTSKTWLRGETSVNNEFNPIQAES